jgi:hypothetical protein
MVLIVSNRGGVRHKDLANSLAVELGWRCVDADEFRFLPLSVRSAGAPAKATRPTWLASLQQTMAFALERRESIVVACPPLTDAQREALRGNLRPVRFVALHERVGSDGGDGGAGAEALVDLVVEVDPHTTPERVLGEIRREFGV